MSEAFTVSFGGQPLVVELYDPLTAAALAQVQTGAALAAAARAAAEYAQQMAELASNIATSGGAYYNTKAAATAALGGIAANAYVTVLADESIAGGRSVYQKSGGVLTLRADLARLIGPQLLTVPAGDGGANPKIGQKITGGGGATDVGLDIDMDDGSFIGLVIRQMSTGRQMVFKRFDGMWEGVVTSGVWATAKSMGVSAGIVEDNGLDFDDPLFQVDFYPPNQIDMVMWAHTDVLLAKTVRGYNGGVQLAELFMKHDGYGYRLDMCDGTIRFARADLRPYVGDKNSTIPAAMTTAELEADYATLFPLSFGPFEIDGNHGFLIDSDDPDTIGEPAWFVRVNGGLAAADTGRFGVQHEADSWTFGNDTDATVIKGSQLDIDGIPKLKSYTVGTLPSAPANPRGLIYMADGTANKRLAISDGTNWRFPDGAIVS